MSHRRPISDVSWESWAAATRRHRPAPASTPETAVAPPAAPNRACPTLLARPSKSDSITIASVRAAARTNATTAEAPACRTIDDPDGRARDSGCPAARLPTGRARASRIRSRSPRRGRGNRRRGRLCGPRREQSSATTACRSSTTIAAASSQSTKFRSAASPSGYADSRASTPANVRMRRAMARGPTHAAAAHIVSASAKPITRRPRGGSDSAVPNPATAQAAHCQPADRSSATSLCSSILIDAMRASSIRAAVAESAATVPKPAQHGVMWQERLRQRGNAANRR